jgi:hypothetical protein
MHLIAIWPGPEQPDLQLLLQPLVRDFYYLSTHGISIYDRYKGIQRQLFAFLLQTTEDLPAHAKV